MDGKRGKSTFSLFMAPALRLGFLSTTFFKCIKIQHEELGLYLTYCLGPNCICSEVAQSPVLLAFPNVESGFTPQLTVYEGLCHPLSTEDFLIHFLSPNKPNAVPTTTKDCVHCLNRSHKLTLSQL